VTDFTRPWHASYSAGVPAEIDVPDEPLDAALDRAAATWPDRVAVDFLGATVTYRELADQVARGAAALRDLGVVAGDRVAIALPNCTSHVVAFYAVLRIGAVVVEHNPTYTAAELAHQLRDSGATVALVWEKAVDAALAARESSELRTVVSVDVSADLPWTKRLALHLPLRKARQTREALRAEVPEGTPVWHRLVDAARCRRTTRTRPPATSRCSSTPAAPPAPPRPPCSRTATWSPTPCRARRGPARCPAPRRSTRCCRSSTRSG
jgi:long-chain acyl-CoA synthetase